MKIIKILLLFLTIINLISCGSSANAGTVNNDNSNICTNPEFTAVELERLDENGSLVTDTSTPWKILHIKDAQMYVEMKNDFTVDETYNRLHCDNLVLGGVSDWKIASLNNISGIRGVYYNNPEYFTKVNEGNYTALGNGNSIHKEIYNFKTGVGDISKSGYPDGYYMCIYEY